jgi:DNA-binding response OmpR family regulator
VAAKILLLDNDLRLLTHLSERLTYLGYDVTTASRVHDAVLKGIVVTPDLFVCDVMMPELNGWEFKRLLAQIPSLATVPILFLSTHNILPAELYDPTVGLVEVLKKPYAGEALVAAVASLLARQAGRVRLMTQPLTGSLALDGASQIELCHVLVLRATDSVVRLSWPGGTAEWTWSRARLIDAATADESGEEAFYAAMTAPPSSLAVVVEPPPPVPPRPTITKPLATLIAEALRRRAQGEDDPTRAGAGTARRLETDAEFLERLAATGLIRRITPVASGR